jgi:hypothetical protein
MNESLPCSQVVLNELPLRASAVIFFHRRVGMRKGLPPVGRGVVDILNSPSK